VTRHHVLRVPATTANLGPGFDAFGAAVSRYLYARSVPGRDQSERVRATGEGAREVATGDDNLIWRCLVRFCAEHDVAVPDIGLRIHNEVPLERGLGSSSAAIVAGLALARHVTDTQVGDLDLIATATDIEGHPDNVAPAVLGGLVICVSDDAGRLVTRPAQPAPRLRPVVMIPQTRQLTTAARAVLPESLCRGDVAHQAARAGHVVGALLGAWPIAAAAAGDLLHEPARLAVMPATGAVIGELRAHGLHAWLSGAGPTVTAAVPRADVTALETCRSVGAAHDFTVEVLDWDRGGVVSCPDDGCGLSGSGGCVQCPAQRV
jgi:homoserine kinase